MPNDYHIFFSSETNEWATPQSLFDDLVALFGVPVGVLKNVYRSLIDEWRSVDRK